MKKRALLGGKLLNPNDYLAAIELSGDMELTIASVQHDKLWREGQREPDIKPTVSFKETPKKLVLNRTNEDTIVRLHGNNADAWSGKRITLYPDTTRVGPSTEPCIRVRDKPPTPQSIGAAGAKRLLARLEKCGSAVEELMAAIEPVPDTDQVAEWPRSLVPQIVKFLDGQEAK